MKNHTSKKAIAILTAMLLVFSTALSGCGQRGKDKDSSSTDSSSSDSSQEGRPDEVEVPDDEESSSSESESEASSSIQSGGTSSNSASSQTLSNKDPSPPSKPPAVTPPQTTTSAPPAVAPPVSVTPPVTPSVPRPTPPSSTPSKDLSNAAYKMRGTYSTKASYMHGSIHTGNVNLYNKTFYGDLTITSAVGSGEITLENVDVRGTLYFEGGSGWLNLKNTHVAQIVSDNKNAKIYAEQKTNVNKVVLKRDAVLQERSVSGGGFENIFVAGDRNARTYVTLYGLSLGELTTQTQSWITTDKGTKIGRVYADAPTYLKGSGTILKLTASSDYVYYQTRPEKVYVSGGAKAPRKYDSGNNYWNNSGSSSSSSSSSHDTSDDRDDVYITWVDSVQDIVLRQGEKETIRMRTNARNVSAYSSNTSVLGIDVDYMDELVLTARQPGSARVTVRGTRSGYNTEERSFVVTVSQGTTMIPQFVTQPNVPDPSVWTQTKSVSFQISYPNTMPLTSLELLKDGVISPLPMAQSTVSTAWNGVVTATYSFITEENGVYMLRATNRAGSVLSMPLLVNCIDHIKPILTLGLSATGPNDNRRLDFTVTDAGGAPLNEMKVVITDQRNPSNPFDAAKNTTSGSYFFTTKVATGETAKFTITATDKAGNVAINPDVVIADLTEPPTPTPPTPLPTVPPEIINIVVGSVERTPTSRVVVNFRVTDQQGIQSVTFNGTEVMGTAGNYSVPVTANGIYTIVAKNIVNLTATAQAVVNILDATIPEIVSVEVTPTGTAQSKVVSFSVTDAGGIASVQVNGTEYGTSGSYKVPANANGSYSIVAVDTSGNRAIASVVVEGIDLDGPQIQIVQTPAVGWAASKTLQFKADDVNGIKSVTLNGIACQADMNGVYQYVDNIEGPHVLNISATDSLGNTASATVDVSQIDKTAPAAPALTQGSGNTVPVFDAQNSSKTTYVSKLTDLTVTGAVGASGNQSTARLEYKLSGGVLPASTAWISVPVKTVGTVTTHALLLPMQAATYTLVIRTVDEASNATIREYHITVPIKAPSDSASPPEPTGEEAMDQTLGESPEKTVGKEETK